ncbi:MAG: MaoC family dehydratase N-terminal domain-containing protein [Halioglobus sp.]
MSEEIPIDHLRNWIGKRECVSDTITPELLKRFRATLGDYTPLGDEDDPKLPLGLHWALGQPAITSDGLGLDGHPAKGGFLPPVPLPRRMWASSRVAFHQSPGIGKPIERISTIADVVHKHSAASGDLVFVHVDHRYTQSAEEGAQLLIDESQVIVYRQPSAFKPAKPQNLEAMPKNPAHSLKILPDSTLLFRYSAITFNGHRIHYDHHYTTGVEGYPGLVVHGPLMATLLMNFAQANRSGSPLKEFEFRGAAPAFVDQALELSLQEDGAANDDDTETLEIRNHEGALIMTATAGFGA